MNTTRMTISVLTAVGLLVGSACGSKNKKPPTEPTSTAVAEKTSDKAPARAEKATGQLREILLALRRVHFAFDSDELLPASRDALAAAGTELAKLPKVALYVQGHADDRGTSEYNIALGERRARAVTNYLVRMGVPTERLYVISYGEEQPIDGGQGMTAWAMNRRVDYRLMRGDVRVVLEDGALFDDKGSPLDVSAKKTGAGKRRVAAKESE